MSRRTTTRARRRRAASILAQALVLAGLLTACGVPDATPVTNDTAAPAGSQVLPGELLYVADGDVYRWSADDGSERVIDVDAENGRAESPDWSPNGQRFAWVRRSVEGYSDLLIANRKGGTLQEITDNRPDAEPYSRRFSHFSYWATDPTWSPVDAEQIVYVSDRGGVEVVFSEDPNDPQRLSDPMFLWIHERNGVEPYILDAAFGLALAQENPDFDPTGTAVTFTTRRDASTTQIWTLDLDTAEAELLVPQDAYDPAWSPNGDTIAYIQRDGLTNDIWLIPQLVDGSWGTPYPLTSGCACVAPEWSPDGKHLAFIELVDGAFHIALLPLQRGEDGRDTAGKRAVLVEDAHIDASSGISWWAP